MTDPFDDLIKATKESDEAFKILADAIISELRKIADAGESDAP